MNKILRDKYISITIIMLVYLYILFVAPILSKSHVRLVDTLVFKLFVLCIISYVATKNHVVAIMISLAYLLTIDTFQKHQINDKIVNIMIIDNIGAVDENTIVPIPTEINKKQEHPKQSSENKHETEHMTNIKPSGFEKDDINYATI